MDIIKTSGKGDLDKINMIIFNDVKIEYWKNDYGCGYDSGYELKGFDERAVINHYGNRFEGKLRITVEKMEE